MDDQMVRRDLLRNALCGAALLGAGTLWHLAPASAPVAAPDDHGFKSIAITAKRPRSLAISRSHCFVATTEGLLVIDQAGKTLSTWSSSRPIRCVAVQPNGDVLLGLAHHLERRNPDGALLERWNSFDRDFLVQSISIAEDQIYVADSKGRAIVQLDSAGKVVRTIWRKQGASALSSLYGVAGQRDGTVHVTNPQRYCVESYDRDGRLVHVFGEKSRELSGFNGCCNPVGISLLGDGNLVTAERGRPRVKLFSPSGEFLSLVAGPGQLGLDNQEQLASENCALGLCIATDGDRRIAVLDQTQQRLHIFTV